MFIDSRESGSTDQGPSPMGWRNDPGWPRIFGNIEGKRTRVICDRELSGNTVEMNACTSAHKRVKTASNQSGNKAGETIAAARGREPRPPADRDRKARSIVDQTAGTLEHDNSPRNTRQRTGGETSLRLRIQAALTRIPQATQQTPGLPRMRSDDSRPRERLVASCRQLVQGRCIPDRRPRVIAPERR